MSAPAWVVTASGDHVRTTADPGSRLVAELLGRDRTTREQDGALIAAAPELLEIARWAEAALSYMAHTSPTKEDRPEFARRFAFAHHVIARAEGRA